MRLIRTTLLICIALIAISSSVKAQAYLEDPKYGAIPEEREKNVTILNYFSDAYKLKNYDSAAEYMKMLINNAPKSHMNIYIFGANIYKSKIAEAKSEEQKKLLVDTLMYIYDKRVENFGGNPKMGESYILEKKVYDYMSFQPQNRRRIHKLFRDAVNCTDNAEDELMTNFLNVLAEDYQMDSLETEEFLNEYEKMAGIFDKKEKNEKVEKSRKIFDQIFIASGAANCENLEKLFKPRFEANPNDVELMKKIVGLMARNNCNSEFQLKVAEHYYKIEPTASTASALASAFEEKKDHAKTIQYLKEAVSKETNISAKSNYLVRASAAELNIGNNKQAADFAKEAIAINSANGYAYVMLSQAYSNGSASACSDFNRQTVFWLVVDNLNEAKRLLSGDSKQIESINTQLSSYSSYYPTAEEAFFRDLKSGSSYTVSCGWINGRTTVRIR